MEEITIDGMRVLAPKHSTLEQFATNINPQPGAVDLYELEQNRTNIPSYQDKIASSNFNRVASKGTGPYQIAIKAERSLLLKGLTTYRDAYPNFSSDDLYKIVNFIPNSRFAYYNKLIKRCLEGIAKGTKTITPADVKYVDSVWMNDESKTLLKNFLSMALDTNSDGFSIQPTPSRSGVRFQDAPGINTGSYIALKNPGNVYMPIDTPNLSNYHVKLLQKLDEEINKIMDQYRLDSDLEPLYDSVSGDLQKTLLYFRDKLTSGMTYDELTKLSKSLSDYLGIKKSKYLSSLSNPFKIKSVRIPTTINPPSAVFSIRTAVPLTTNAIGNVAFAINPYMLNGAGLNQSGSGINNDVTLTGLASSNFFATISIGQTLPADFYVKYRLVSSGIRVYAYPSSNNDNGIMTISTTFENFGGAVIPAVITGAAQFGDFTQIENGYFKQTTTVASRQVLESSYLPMDESHWDYTNLGTAKTGASWVGYITGAAPASTIARLELVMNFEALLDNSYTDYLPSESPMQDQDPKLIMAAISRAKQADDLKPLTLNKIFEESNHAISPDSEIKLPPSQYTKKESQSHLNTLADIAKDLISFEMKKPGSNILTTAMDVVSPVLSSMIKNMANPFSNIGLPFKF